MTTKPSHVSLDRPACSRSHCPTLITVASAFLNKLAKHLALLACLMIVGKATGRFTIGQFPLFLLIVFAALAHFVGRTLLPRLPTQPFKIPP